jgi:hypothetical protein
MRAVTYARTRVDTGSDVRQLEQCRTLGNIAALTSSGD